MKILKKQKVGGGTSVEAALFRPEVIDHVLHSKDSLIADF